MFEPFGPPAQRRTEHLNQAVANGRDRGDLDALPPGRVASRTGHALFSRPFTNVIRSTNCTSRRGALACAPFSMIEQNGQAVTTVLGARVLELLEAHVADARSRLLFFVGKQQPAAGAAAVRVLTVSFRFLHVRAKSCQQIPWLIHFSAIPRQVTGVVDMVTAGV